VDSICLTYLLSQYRRIHQPDLQVHAITIDHQYRVGSEKEAEAVGNIVVPWGVNHIISRLSYDKPVSHITNFEEHARLKRYETFNSLCHQLHCQSLLVGHTLDDQLETFLHRLQQNSSLLGLVGLKPKSLIPVEYKYGVPNVFVYRPLLEYKKSQLIETCTKNHIPWFEDVTNQDHGLTKRNFFRYLMNVYIPNNPDLQVISKESLHLSFQQVAWFSKRVIDLTQQLQALLETENLITRVDSNASLTIQFPRRIIVDGNTLVVSRFLFNYIYPISAVKHYHWAYARIEKHLYPKILQFLNSTELKIRLTYLNLQFDISKSLNYVTVSISRQPILRHENFDIKYISNETWGDWVLFDRRFWLRLKSNSKLSLVIIPYQHRLHKSQLHPRLVNKVTRKMDFSPAILFNDEIIAFPTFSFSTDPTLLSEWSLKPSIYTNR
jgi:tRNA(Ile)-lysidine synthetase-like protein